MIPHYQAWHARQLVNLEGPDLAGTRWRETWQPPGAYPAIQFNHLTTHNFTSLPNLDPGASRDTSMQNLSLTLERGVDSRVVLEILEFPRSAISGSRDFRLP
jgi:hypothetical protein